jgi:hypothetical protein
MKKPYVVPLPPEVVALLESKHQSKKNLTQSPSWLALKSHLQETLEKMERWSSHEGLDAPLSTAKERLSSLEAGLGEETDMEKVTQEAYRLFGALNEYVRLRETLDVCALPEVNAAVHAIHALKRGRLEWPEVEPTKQELVARVDTLVSLFKDGSDHLPPEIQHALLKGFDSMNNAVAQWNTQDSTKLDDLAANLASAGTILEHLDKWQKDFEAELKCEVPLVGREFKAMLMELESQGGLSNATLDAWYEDVGPRLQEFWTPARHDFFMPRAFKDRLVGRIDTCLYNLQDLENMPPQQQYDALREVADAFAELPTRTFERDAFEHYPQPWLFDTFSAALAKGVPRFQLEWMAAQMSEQSDTYEMGRCLQSYLDSDDRDYILDALELMQKESERNFGL